MFLQIVPPTLQEKLIFSTTNIH